MNYLVSGTFKKGTATNVDQNVTVDIAGLKGSTAIYTATPTDAKLTGTANGEVIGYFLKLGGVAAYRLVDITQIEAGGGNDLVDLTNAANPYALDVTIDGGEGNDTLWSGPGDDILLGGNDNDSIWGGAGNDSISGGSGTDTILGGIGNDTILAGATDFADAGGGDDTLIPDAFSASTTNGGAGNDRFNVPFLNGNIFLDGGADWDVVFGTQASNVMDLYAWNSNFVTDVEEIDATTSAGGAGFLRDWSTSSQLFDFSQVKWTNVQSFSSSSGSDTIIGTSGDDVICLFANSTNSSPDLVDGGPGSDTFDEEGTRNPGHTFVFKNGEASDSIRLAFGLNDKFDISDFGLDSLDDLTITPITLGWRVGIDADDFFTVTTVPQSQRALLSSDFIFV